MCFVRQTGKHDDVPDPSSSLSFTAQLPYVIQVQSSSRATASSNMDPLSVTASVIAIATLAEAVVTRFTKYCKAVKNCEDEVRKLMVEVNILAGLLERLARMSEEGEEDELGDLTDASLPVVTPSYIPACQSTLKEIELVLITFERKGARVPVDSNTQPVAKRSLFHRLQPKDLKWPFSKDKTLELIANVERYKSTCILALSADSLSAIRKVLNVTKLSKSILTDIKSTSEALVQFHESKETRKILQWFGPLNPASKHRIFRDEYQKGTGYWIFDTPEYLTWMNTQKSGLWIYGIPGAGKTILASLIIETLSSAKPRSCAYFYVRYDDPESQKPTNILGSLVAQLCQQNTRALEDALEFYASYNIPDDLPKSPTTEELGTLLKRVSLHFETASIVIDGLDEVGAAKVIDRSDLICVLSILHRESSNIRTIVFSRAEADIKNHLRDFSQVSIAARSADLQLYVAAKIHKLGLKDGGLKTEVLEALVDGAEGMFFWTVCQIQLLQNLPTPASVRKALSSLPPGLPATYCRVFEKIDAEYPIETQLYIQRALNWLVWGSPELQIDAFMHMICMHDEIEELHPEEVPGIQSIPKWLGCLVRPTGDSFELAHFSIKEFLLSSRHSQSDMSSTNISVVQKYLMPEKKRFGPALACVSYLSLKTITQTPFNLFDVEARNAFNRKFPFYEHASINVKEYILNYEPEEESPQFQRLFSALTPQRLYFWIQYVACVWPQEQNRSDYTGWTKSECFGDASHRTSSLHVACELRLVRTVSRLLSEGVSPDTQFARNPTPLHLVLYENYRELLCYNETALLYLPRTTPVSEAPILRIVSHLLDANADVDITSRYTCSISDNYILCSPLYVAIWYRLGKVCEVLLEHGASIIGDRPALLRLVEVFEPGHEEGASKTWLTILDRVLEHPSYDSEVRGILEQFRSKAVPPTHENDSRLNESNNRKAIESANMASELDEGLQLAAQQRDLDLIRYYLDKGADLHVKNRRDEIALFTAIENEDNDMIKLLTSRGLRWDHISLNHRISLIEGLSESASLTLSLAINNWNVTTLSDEELKLLYERSCLFAWLDILRHVLDTTLIQRRWVMLREYLPIWREEDLGIQVLEIAEDYGLLGVAGLTKLFLSICTREEMHKIPEFLSSNLDFDPVAHEPVVHDEKWVRVRCRSFSLPCCVCWAVDKASSTVLNSILKRVDELHGRGKILGHLSIAAQRGHHKILELLLSWGDDPNRTCSRGLSPIHYAVGIGRTNIARPNHGVLKIIELLKLAGADLAATCRGRNAVHYAMTNGSMTVIRHLVSHGLDINAEDCVGERPLHIAIRQGFGGGLNFILKSTPQDEMINRSSDNCGTPLYCAAREGNVTFVEKLLCAGASVNAVILPGNILGPALYVACAEGHTKLVRILLSHGADRKVRTSRYKSAMEVAKAFEQHEVLEVLEGYGQSDLTYRESEAPPSITGIDEDSKGTGWSEGDIDEADNESIIILEAEESSESDY
ncbi:hypothetical protein VTL71DRAFT_14012 [Oculimacula yallundae]|uniref:Nephrocystin 3-like N-terminal domain-containing protein n=1 Tax=Oculimacula yallundae TaxID=86028 RepID=A0ABR4CNL4_9HELO